MTVDASVRSDSAGPLTGAATAESPKDESRELAERYAQAGGSSLTVAAKLEALEVLGWRVLLDRRWVASSRATIDALLIGPGGVIVLDVKAWHDVQVTTDGLFCGLERRDADASSVRGIADKVHDAFAELGVTRQALLSVLLLTGRQLDAHTQHVHLVGEDNLAAWVAGRPARLEESDIDLMATILERVFPAHDGQPPLATRIPVAGTEAPAAAFAITRSRGLDVEDLAAALVRSASTRPLERWMTFLRPDQRELVDASWDGPARLTGAAGSGKTVVALHRAAAIAERSATPVLFVAPVTALPSVVSGLGDRLAPQSRDRMVFTSLIDLATAIVEQGGISVNLDDRSSSIAFMSAWMSSGRGGPLMRLDERASYWQEEIDRVIKSRGITALEEYAELDRADRLVPLDGPEREAVWRLYVEYQRRLAKSKILDANDVVTVARDMVRDGAVVPTYSAVIADEAQDLTLVGLQLLMAIAGTGPDGLLLIDDGHQAVLPGAWTLVDAGLRLPAGPAVLTSDHRSTADILGLAAEMVAADMHPDLGGGAHPYEPGIAVRRRGPIPAVVYSSDQTQLDNALVRRLIEIDAAPGASFGDAAVLVATDVDADRMRSVMMRAALPVVALGQHLSTNNRVVVGTFAAAKGLSFDHVLMPGITNQPVAQTGEHAGALRERSELRRRQQYVGITRARHGLWLGFLEGA